MDNEKSILNWEVVQVPVYSVVMNKRGSSIEPQIKVSKVPVQFWPDGPFGMDQCRKRVWEDYQDAHQNERVIGLSPEKEIRFLARKYKIDADKELKEVKGADRLMKIGKEFALLKKEMKEDSEEGVDI